MTDDTVTETIRVDALKTGHVMYVPMTELREDVVSVINLDGYAHVETWQGNTYAWPSSTTLRVLA